jgi:malate dehydrogenase
MSSTTLKICITGAAGQIANHFIPQLLNGYIFKDDIKISLSLLDINIPPVLKMLNGIKLELEDCNFPSLLSVNTYTDAKEAFKDCDIIIFLGGFPRKPGMNRSDLLNQNSKIFIEQGEALINAKIDCKCIVIANPCNTNCEILYKTAKKCNEKINKNNFSSLSRLDQNRCESLYKINTNNEINGIIIGNHSNTMVIENNNNIKFDDKFVEKIQKRGGEILETKGLSSSFSAAKAIADHLKDLFYGNSNKLISMGIVVEKDDEMLKNKNEIVCSLPLKLKGNFQFEVDKEIMKKFLNESSINEKIQITLKELNDEIEMLNN